MSYATRPALCPAVDRGYRATASIRVGMIPPARLLEQGAQIARARLTQAAEAGTDHVCSGDHVSFAGMGLDGLVHATPLAMLHPSAEDVAEFLAPYAPAGCTEFNLIPPAPGRNLAISGTAAVKRLLVSA